MDNEKRRKINMENSEMETETRRKVSAVVIGCGQRGTGYSNYSKQFPDLLQIVGVADPKKNRRENVAKRTGLTNPDLIVDDWTKLASMEKLADCAFITTQDRMHLAPAMAFASKGYHLLLEKPMSVNEEECKQESYLHIYIQNI